MNQTSTEVDIELWLDEEMHCEAQHKKGLTAKPSNLPCSHTVTAYFHACYLAHFGKPSLYVCENFVTETMHFVHVNHGKPCIFCATPIEECISISNI